MNATLLLQNLTNPTLLFFLLGIVATLVKSDLQIPESTSKFISLYLLFAIGFKGGQELANSQWDAQIGYVLLIGMAAAAIIPLYSFFLLKTRMKVADAGAVAAAYGSVSAVTFVAAASFLEAQQQTYSGYMVAVLALMEFPAIVMGVVLMRRYDHPTQKSTKLGQVLHHSITNGSVLLLVGSLLIGWVADSKQAEGIKPFTTDIFKGFLAIFLLEMGMITARRFGAFRQYGWFAAAFALVVPLVNGCVVALVSEPFIADVGNRFMLSILAASASYIAVPAAMRLAAPKADPGLYLPMALGITFPLNITIGMPLYWWLSH